MTDLSRFRPQRRNANKHTQRGLGMLDKAMSEDGYVAPITVAADGETIDGSARLERAAERFAGVEPLVVKHDGTRPVVMVRTDIPSAEEPIAKRIALRANRIAEVDLSWDEALLEELRAELPELSGEMFDTSPPLLGEDESSGSGGSSVRLCPNCGFDLLSAPPSPA